MRYDTEHKERTRARVLDEAAATIRAVGPDGIGVAGLMAKVGLTHGGFYAHFKSKDDLVAQAISRMFEDSKTMFLSRTEGLPPAEGLANFLDYYLSARHRDEALRGCPLPRLSSELARLPMPARERFAAGAARLTGHIAGKLEEMGIAEPELTAMAVVSEAVGALAMARAVPDRDRSDQILEASRAGIKTRLGLKADQASASSGPRI